MKEIFNREQAIFRLIDDTINTIESLFSEGSTEYVENMLSVGFKGYEDFTNEELEKELNEKFFIEYKVEDF